MPNLLKNVSNVTQGLVSLGSVGMVAIAVGCSSSISGSDPVQQSIPPSVLESTSEPFESQNKSQTESQSEASQPLDSVAESSTQNSTEQSLLYRFDPAQVEPGDRLLGLEIADVEVFSFGPDAYVGTVEFQGEVIVSGTYSPQTALPGSEVGIPCFFVSGDSDSQLPRFGHDERDPWFCFTNPEIVQAAFENSSAEQLATIVVDSYKTVYVPSDVYNEARFVRIEAP